MHRPPAWTRALAKQDKLVEVLGVQVSHGLLFKALTHRSYAYENGGLPTNERLEFLGDSVLGLVVTSALYNSIPHCPRGSWPNCAPRWSTCARWPASAVASAR